MWTLICPKFRNSSQKMVEFFGRIEYSENRVPYDWRISGMTHREYGSRSRPPGQLRLGGLLLLYSVCTGSTVSCTIGGGRSENSRRNEVEYANDFTGKCVKGK